MPKKTIVGSRSVSIERQTNIGPSIAGRLRGVGARTLADLERIGPAAAYLRICERHPGKTIPVCYNLYSLEGALCGKRWDRIGGEAKQSLLRQVGRR
jgi:DNA transformation protein